jgi:hypothetical protein
MTFSLDHSRLIISALDLATGSFKTVERSEKSVEHINRLSETYRSLVALRSFSSESDPIFIHQAQKLGEDIYHLFFEGLEDVFSGASSLLLLHNVFLVPLELAYDGGEFIGIRFSVGNWLKSSGELNISSSGHRLRRDTYVRALFLGPEQDRDSVWGFLGNDGTSFHCDSMERVATKNLLATLQKTHYDCLHFAGHGWFNEDNPRDGYLVLDDGLVEESSVLRCDELARVPLRRTIVFLNACQSGTVNRNYRGFVGFADAFLQAGASSCVATLWSINDRSAALFAREFYRNIAAGATVGDSVKQARRECWLSGKGILTSLAYVLFGRPDRIIGEEEQENDSAVPPNPAPAADG